MSDTCPCGSGHAAAECCIPVIAGEREAPTAEALMRSRYSAFVLGEVDYILESHHPRTREEVDREEVERWSRDSEWLGLEVFGTAAGGEHDDEGIVSFSARYRADGEEHDHREHAVFERLDGQWKFVDAGPVRMEPIRREQPKVGRNEPCPCGSGRKHKACCLAV